ncbi:probable geranylgeranyl-diphosphate geranylgeranyltransferase (AL-2) [Phialocephala subalpina]|uniref:Bifunctional lycopene cyclase/phytoene synthase n=1 Tax=Phialocephala subalpina TaxID=576137 RepID=A0A1L7XG70_9HELO|nr:probable geranylgeranyl-diphosphate geranylgeranyltransferase (AL-2) [Phialocephala subalpina]
MGFEYALVHLKYTIPLGIALTIVYRPFLNRIDLFKIAFLIAIAVISTIPWDSYLVRRKIWTYPPSVIIGPTLFSIPAEEVFFFIIQTYNTTLLYLLLNKPVFQPSYLARKSQEESIFYRNVGQTVLGACVLAGGLLVWRGNEGTYLGLILVWAGPFALLLWSLSSDFLVNLPYTSTIAPIAIPTFYLWIVDTLALRRGTWTIESGTKLGIHVWDGLEIEEAVFFLATNTLIVFGQAAFDHALTILLTFPRMFPNVPELPSPVMLVQALLTDPAKYDEERVTGIREAVSRLQKKSRSFHLASSTFSGRLRVDLILLYSFCRVADDLVDNAPTEAKAREWIGKLTHYLDLAYVSKEVRIIQKQPDLHSHVSENFPESSQSALRLLPTHLLPFGPLYDLLEGFKTDLEFHNSKFSEKLRTFPIANEHDLEVYSARVAGTVAELCLELVFFHTYSPITTAQREHLLRSGSRMGIALQYINIARDIATDAAVGRVYLPTSWLKEFRLSPQDVLENPESNAIEKLRGRLLKKAFGVYEEARFALSELPPDARAPMRVAVESYMEIGRVLQEKGYKVKEGKATVPKLRRLKVAWKALNEK